MLPIYVCLMIFSGHIYLTNRSKYVYINMFKSDRMSTNVGVPQGSIIWPALFNVFINYIINAGYNSVFYADYGVFYVTCKTLNGCVDMMNDHTFIKFVARQSARA